MSDQLLSALGQLLELTPEASKLRPGPPPVLDLDGLRDSIELLTPASRMVAAFEAWAARHQLRGASLAVLRRGHLVARAGYGDESPDMENEFASCSKLITGLAIAQLVRQGKLRYDTTMEEIFGRTFSIGWRHLNDIALRTEPRLVDIVSRFGVLKRAPRGLKPFEFASARVEPKLRRGPAPRKPVGTPLIVPFPAWFLPLTVTEVLTHTSGIRGGIGEGNPYEISLEERLALMVTSMQAGPKTFVYENNNYVLLGVIIQRLTGKDFQAAAKELVLEPLGIMFGFTADNRGPYAGCWLSTANYARMLRYLDRELSPLGAHGPATWPRVGSYSIGTFAFGSGDSFETNHAGGWTWNDGFRRSSLEAFHEYWQDVRTGYFLRYSPSSSGAFGELAGELRAIAHDPTNWWPPFLDLLERLYKLTR